MILITNAGAGGGVVCPGDSSPDTMKWRSGRVRYYDRASFRKVTFVNRNSEAVDDHDVEDHVDYEGPSW